MREPATICQRPLQFDLCPFNLESGVRVTCAVSYLCSIVLSSLACPFSTSTHMFATDRQTTDVHAHQISPILGASNNTLTLTVGVRVTCDVRYLRTNFSLARSRAPYKNLRSNFVAYSCVQDGLVGKIGRFPTRTNTYEISVFLPYGVTCA